MKLKTSEQVTKQITNQNKKETDKNLLLDPTIVYGYQIINIQCDALVMALRFAQNCSPNQLKTALKDINETYNHLINTNY